MSSVIAETFDLSPSRINDYFRCEEKIHKAKFQFWEGIEKLAAPTLTTSALWEYANKQRVQRRRFDDSFPMYFGIASHKIFQLFFSTVSLKHIPDDCDIFNLVYYSTMHLAPKPFKSLFEPHCRNLANLEAYRWKQLDKYCSGDISKTFSYWKPLFCEYEIYDPKRGLNGYIDRMERVPPGFLKKDYSERTEYCVADYKTGKVSRQFSTDNRRQLFFYAVNAPKEAVPRMPKYYSIIYTKEPVRLNGVFVKQTETAYYRGIKRLEASIISKTWKKSLSRKYACRWCDFYKWCWSELTVDKLIALKRERSKERKRYETL